MSKLVSVIVPIYNVKDYLIECVESILNQTYSNIEIILVDDGSTDGSAGLCDNLRQRDDRIIVIHKKNGGLSDARNVGFRKSTGEFVIFVDSDDSLKSSALEIMVSAIEEYDADISACEFETFEDNSIKRYNSSTQEKSTEMVCLTGKKLVESLYKGNYQSIAFVAWNKLYKRKLFSEYEIEYPVGRMYEDTFTTYKLLYNSRKAVLVLEPLYNYRIRNGSIMKSSITLKKTQDWLDGELDAFIYFLGLNEKYLENLAGNSFFRSQILFYKKIDDNSEFGCKEYLITEYKKIYDEYIKLVNIPCYKKIIYKLFCFFPKAISKLF